MTDYKTVAHPLGESGMVDATDLNSSFPEFTRGVLRYTKQPYMAGMTRIELAVAGLEAAGLPLTDIPMAQAGGFEPPM